MNQTWQQRREEYLRSVGRREFTVISGGRQRVVIVQDVAFENGRGDAPQLPDSAAGDCSA